ncbi:hypothetical protein DUPY_50900 [Duganella phyllosphaerae]|uniref:Uncharacterized protein n=2 Tax=Duganella phyllosphaerae TaxID=762836 RepID=A0A1E7W6B1_9BURK|nr:hypothetical protein DUPY_50900 [Duganella phyllosphaerae]
MPDTTRPPNELVRVYFERRTHAQLDPPPTPDEIRRQLGWHLILTLRQPDRDDCN